jgi:hypothetical protein
MSVIRTRRRLALLLAIATVVALSAAGAAYALTASSFKYSSPKTGYVRVSSMAFIPDSPNTTYFNSWPDGLADSVNSCFNTGVDLPQGARVKSITFYFESGAGSDFQGELVRTRLSTGANQEFQVSPSNDAGTRATATANVPSIRQPVTSDHAYGIGVCPGDDGTFFGARVKYTYTSAGS